MAAPQATPWVRSPTNTARAKYTTLGFLFMVVSSGCTLKVPILKKM
jgi:hypothetical protein